MSRTAWRTFARVFSQSAPPIFDRRRLFSAGVLADEPDVFGVDIDAVAALEFDDEPVARDAEHLARLHAEVPADAVHAMHDEVARGEALVVVLPAPRTARRAVDAPATGEVRFRDECEVRAGQYRAAIERGDHDVRGRTDLREDLLDPRLRAGAFGRDEHSEAVGPERVDARAEPIRVADDRIKGARGEHRRVGIVGAREHERGTGACVREETVERERQPRRVGGIGRAPRRRQCRRERELLVEQLLRSVAQPARLDDGDERARRQEIGEQVLLGREPRQPGLHAVERLAVSQSLPLLAAPGIALPQLGGTGAHVVGRQQLAYREQPHLGEVAVRPLIGHRELREAVDLVTPEIDAHRMIRGGRVDVDDRAAHRELAARFHLVLAPVAHRDQPFHELVTIQARARPHHDRLDVLDVRTEPLHQRTDRGHDHRGEMFATCPQAPHHPQAPAHRLRVGRHPFERERLPRREQLHRVVADVLAKVGRDPLGLCARGHRDEHRPARRCGRERRGEDRARGLGHGHGVALSGARRDDRGIVGEQRGQPGKGRGVRHVRGSGYARETRDASCTPGVRHSRV